MTQDQINKLGNAVLYLSGKVEDPSKTKILKLIYLLEEESVKRYNSPFFGFTFYAWQFGPVHKELWESVEQEIKGSKKSFLSDFVSIHKKGDGCYFSPKVDFIDDEFSDNDMDLLNYMVEKYCYAAASNLVNITHDDGSLWKNTVLKEEGLLERLESGKQTTSDLTLDFSELLDSDSKKEFLKSELDFLNFSTSLKH